MTGGLPAGELALLTGPGSVGKVLALQIAAALACDREPLQNAGGWLPAGPAVFRDRAGAMRRARAHHPEADGREQSATGAVPPPSLPPGGTTAALDLVSSPRLGCATMTKTLRHSSALAAPP